MENVLLLCSFAFILVRWSKTFLFIKNYQKYDELKMYFIVPEFILFLTFVYTIFTVGESIEGTPKVVLLATALLGAITSSIGVRFKNKIAMVLSIMLFMYAFGICLTKNHNFMLP